MGKKNTERTIVLAYSFYTLALGIAAAVLDWPDWINPVLLAALLSVWVVHVRGARDLRFRSFFYSVMSLATFAVYGTLENSFEGIIGIFCVVIVFLSMLNLPELIFPEILISLFLIVYHAVIYHGIPFGTAQEKIRSSILLFSVFAVEGIVYGWLKYQERTRQRLRETIRELEEAKNRNERFIVKAFEELRLPADRIYEIGEKTPEEGTPDSTREDMAYIREAGRKLYSMVENVQLFSRLESGELTYEEKDYSTAEFVDHLAAVALAYRGSKKLELIVDCDAKMPRVLQGDPKRLQQALFHLLHNGIKYTQAGGVSVILTARPEDYGINLSVKVKDTAGGISPEDLERLFDGYAPTGQKGGIGVGLGIAKGIVEGLGGFLSVKSEAGKGSEFQFVVPQKIADNRPMAAVRNTEGFNIIFYIDAEKPVLVDFRDDYMGNIRRMLEGLEVRHCLCHSMADYRRRTKREIYTHVFLAREEYLENASYFDELFEQMQIVVIQDRDGAILPGGKVKSVYTPFHVGTLAAILNGEDAGEYPVGAMAADKRESEDAKSSQEKRKEHINRSEGMQYYGGELEDYLEILRIYVSAASQLAEQIRESYESQNWENYIIYVHTLKSTAFGIGAMELGEMAKALETAGKEGDVSYILAHHEAAMKEYEEVLLEIERGQ